MMKLPRENIDLSNNKNPTSRFWANYESWIVWQFGNYISAIKMCGKVFEEAFDATIEFFKKIGLGVLMIIIIVFFPIVAPIMAYVNMKLARERYLKECGLKELLRSRRKRIKKNTL